MRKLTALVIFACIAVSASFAQTRQQALDEIARMEKVAAQLPEMLRKAWEAGITQKDTVIDTPYGKLTIKFDLDEIIKETYTGASLTVNLETWHGVQQGNEISINNGGSWRNKTPEGMKATITHELGHFMDRKKIDRINNKLPVSKYWTVEALTEIEAEAFAMRYIGKSEYTAELKRGGSITQNYIDAITNRAEEMEREEKETLARLRAIANAPAASTAAAASPPAAAASSAASPPVVAVAAAQKPSVNPAQALADSAIAAFGRKEYDKAIADYTRANADRTIADCEAALRIDPNNEAVKLMLGLARQMKN